MGAMKNLLPKNLDELSSDALRALVQQQAAALAHHEQVVTQQKQALTRKDVAIKELELINSKLKHELAVIRRYRFGQKSEQYSGAQGWLFEEDAQADLVAIESELDALNKTAAPKTKAPARPKRRALPPELPRVEIYHEPEDLQCNCGCALKRIDEDVTEKLDYIPGKAQVERHIRGKWVCKKCEMLTQVPMPAHVIDKGIASNRLLAYVLVAKYADHLPLYRQQKRFAREGIALPISTLADWVGQCGYELQPLVDALREEVLQKHVLHADETPIKVLRADKDRKTHRAYLWAYAPAIHEGLNAVIYDFTPSRAGAHARAFLADWQGKLVTDDYSGYKQSFKQAGVTEIACMAHARRKFYELHVANKSEIAAQALASFKALYAIEAEAKVLTTAQRQALREEKSQPILKKLHDWMLAQRTLVPDGSGTAKALDYSLKRWAALTRYLEDGRVPIDNNHIEQQIRPLALGRKNWLFAGSLRAGQRAAAIMTLIQSAKLNGHDPLAYLSDILERLPTQPNNQIHELLPHHWRPAEQ